MIYYLNIFVILKVHLLSFSRVFTRIPSVNTDVLWRPKNFGQFITSITTICYFDYFNFYFLFNTFCPSYCVMSLLSCLVLSHCFCPVKHTRPPNSNLFDACAKFTVLSRTSMFAYCSSSGSDFQTTQLVRATLFDSQHVNIGSRNFLEGTIKEFVLQAALQDNDTTL